MSHLDQAKPLGGSKFTCLLALLWLATCWGASAAPMSGAAGPYRLIVEVEPSPLAVGDAQVAVSVEKDGKPAADTTVVVEAEMDDLCGVPTRATLGPVGQGYEGRVALSLEGKWLLRVKVNGSDGSGEAMFPLQVGQEKRAEGQAITVTTAVPPRTGENLLLIEVRDGAGKPLDNVDVWTGLTMPGMYMHVAPRKATRIGPGRYERKVDLAMAGSWMMTVDVQATDRKAPNKNGRLMPIRLLYFKTVLEVANSHQTAAHLAKLMSGGLFIGLGLVLATSFYRRRLNTATIFGCFLCAITALSVGAALQSHWPSEDSKDMKMDMEGSDTEMSAPIPVVVEKAHRSLFTDVLSVNAKVLPLAEVPVTSTRSGRLKIWRVSPGSAVAKGQIVAEIEAAPGHPALNITAPFEGLLWRCGVNVGGAVRTGEPLFDLARVDTVRVQARIPVGERDRLKVDMPVEIVTFEPRPREAPKPISARLNQVGDLVDEVSQTVAVEAHVRNPELHLRPGQHVTFNLQMSHKPSVVHVPVRALALDRGHPAIWLVGELAGQMVARLHFVEVGLTSPEYVEIISGLQDGDEYIDDGVWALEEGATVTPASRGGGPYRNLLLPTEVVPTPAP